MTFAQLKARAELLCSIEGWANVSPSPDWGSLVNQALTIFSDAGAYIPAGENLTTVQGQAEYSLTAPDYCVVLAVTYNAQTVLLQSSETLIEELDSLWIDRANGTPERWWLSQPNKVRVWPPPATAGVTMKVRGRRVETTLTNASDTPVAPVAYHENIAELAAWLQGKTYAQSPQQLAKVELWRTNAEQGAKRLRARLAVARPVQSGMVRASARRISL
jgi:hypothetical protein